MKRAQRVVLAVYTHSFSRSQIINSFWCFGPNRIWSVLNRFIRASIKWIWLWVQLLSDQSPAQLSVKPSHVWLVRVWPKIVKNEMKIIVFFATVALYRWTTLEHTLQWSEFLFSGGGQWSNSQTIRGQLHGC